MTVPITAFLNTAICSILVFVLWIFMKNNLIITRTLMRAILFTILIIIYQLLVPRNYAVSVSASNIITTMYLLACKPVFMTSSHAFTIRHCIYMIWFSGAAYHLLRTLLIYNRFKKAILAFPEIENKHIQEILRKIIKMYNKSDDIKIIQTPLISTPMLFGIQSSIILVPTGDYTDDDWYFILLHEVTHSMNRHLWLKALTEFVCGIYWWNPMMALFRVVVKRFLEIHVDFTITRKLEETKKIKYIECLLKAARKNLEMDELPMGLTLISPHPSFLLQRFRIIMDGANIKKKRSSYKYLCLLFIPMILTICLSFTLFSTVYYVTPKNGTYLVDNAKGYYDLYVDNAYTTTFSQIKNHFTDIRFCQNIEGAVRNEVMP